ncbi:fructose-bisphosphatase class II [Agromyces atrinae]|uniref:Fructose-1,6-bisphosphatase class 2 n=1 Tax=Agromyces atrinae TaxID=592376 RepID=A0A4Q2M6B3_9MICO|nr:fructose-bisphosphatase class II [Agromyces atrinae]NYD65486.1 fructose-1,6-bisphosphatase II [Agromyces atrinae]RXZ85783.1 fructose-bisphosphatase class II [Agromyces atrinae]
MSFLPSETVDAVIRAARGAALAARPLVGQGDGDAVDAAAVDALRHGLRTLKVDGRVVAGEGEKDDAPMLYPGERFGTGNGPAVDLVVDPVDGTRLAAAGRSGAFCIVALAPRDAFLDIGPAHYAEKVVSAVDGPRVGVPIAESLALVAAARQVPISEVRVAVQTRPRNSEHARAVTDAGAQLVGFEHGDIERSLQVLNGDLDLLIGVGGAPEGVLTAALARTLGGSVSLRFAPQSRLEARRVEQAGLSTGVAVDTDAVCAGEPLVVVASVTGVDLGGGLTLAPATDDAVDVWSSVAEPAERFVKNR